MRPRTKRSAEARRFNEALGRRIAGARMASGIKTVALAKATGIARSTLSHYELGSRGCPAPVIRQIAEVLGISTGALIPKFAGALKSTLKSAPKQGSVA